MGHGNVALEKKNTSTIMKIEIGEWRTHIYIYATSTTFLQQIMSG